MNLGKFREATKHLPNDTTMVTADARDAAIVVEECGDHYLIIVTDVEDVDMDEEMGNAELN